MQNTSYSSKAWKSKLSFSFGLNQTLMQIILFSDSSPTFTSSVG